MGVLIRDRDPVAIGDVPVQLAQEFALPIGQVDDVVEITRIKAIGADRRLADRFILGVGDQLVGVFARNAGRARAEQFVLPEFFIAEGEEQFVLDDRPRQGRPPVILGLALGDGIGRYHLPGLAQHRPRQSARQEPARAPVKRAAVEFIVTRFGQDVDLTALKARILHVERCGLHSQAGDRVERNR